MVRGGKEGAWMDGDKCQDDVCERIGQTCYEKRFGGSSPNTM